MITPLKTAVLFCLICELLGVRLAAQTNGAFRTDNWIGSSNGGIVPDDSTTNPATRLEALPEAMFTNGNWAPVVDGVRLSLRFDKQTYVEGEPIIAIILIRNVTNRYVYLSTTDPTPYYITNALDHTGVRPSDPFAGAAFQSERGRSMPPGMQHRIQELFGKGYRFTNGTYAVEVKFSASQAELSPSHEVASGPATFTVVKPEKPTTPDSK
jgi:hypothetical protein